tara:strand:+ start:1644 stop:2096 length:453 start_codon:yes stop_codon:yes gene_type:complete
MSKLDLQNKNNKPKVSYFVSNEFNYDVNQSLEMLDTKQELVDSLEDSKINDNFYNSVNDSMDYLGCLNSNCSKLYNDLDEDIYNKSKKNKKSQDVFGILVENLDMLINIIYVLITCVLLFYSIMGKNDSLLVQILVITLVYVFYKIYVKM